MSPRDPFGWAYPAGAEFDPNAPYSDRPEPIEEDPDMAGDLAFYDDLEPYAGNLQLEK